MLAASRSDREQYPLYELCVDIEKTNSVLASMTTNNQMILQIYDHLKNSIRL